MSRIDFQTEYKGKQTDLYEIASPKGYRLSLTNYGCRLVSLWAKNTDSELVDVLLGYDSIQEYIADDTNQGALVGRVANRIGEASFELDGKTYNLTKNVNNKHQLHGGIEGFASAVFDVIEHSKSSIILTHTSPDGDQGYPGNLTVKVEIKWTAENVLQTIITATTDQTTVTNLTFHPYFNLLGEGHKNIAGHRIEISADEILEFGEDCIATGNYLKIENTPFDFRKAKAVDFSEVMQTQWGKDGEGIDHFFVLKKHDGTVRKIATVKADNGIQMEIWSDQPGVQFYTSNFLNTEGKGGKPYVKHSGFCLEAQIHPNAPRVAHFPSIRLDPNNVYKNHTEYRF